MSDFKHGRSAYLHRGCRCDVCVGAARAYERDRKRTARERGRETATPHQELADLLQELFPLGLTDDCPARRALAADRS